MVLDKTERRVFLEVQTLPDNQIDALIARLEGRGFEVRVKKVAKVNEPQLVTDVGCFVGIRSIIGFVDRFEKIFEVAHQNARELSRS